MEDDAIRAPVAKSGVDRRHGGHVVNFSIQEGELRCCSANDFQIWLPDAAALSGLNLARDWSDELKQAEAER